MNNIVILHFGPLEIYPPIQNILDFIAGKKRKERIIVFTTGTNVSTLKQFNIEEENLRVKRRGTSGQNINILTRYWTYFIFNITSLVYLLLKRPKSIMYFETISSYPAYLYKRFFNPKVKVFIHYHEYSSLHEYKRGMRLTRFFFSRERWLLSRASWVSHTNEYRLALFLSDLKPVEVANPQVLPNFPPVSWHKNAKLKIDLPVKFVYVGAVSMDTMYVKEFVTWIIEQKGNAIFDIYSYNITNDAKAYLHSTPSEWIRLKPGVNYDELPNILREYSIGIILYKGHIANYIYNAPNKLFEYFMCGLDVWFPVVMEGSLQYRTENTFPKIIALDFGSLKKENFKELISHAECSYEASIYNRETVLKNLIDNITDN